MLNKIILLVVIFTSMPVLCESFPIAHNTPIKLPDTPVSLEIDKKRTVYVTGKLTMPIAYKMAWHSMLLLYNNKPIYIIVDSEGGYTQAGDIISRNIDILKSKGIEVNCVVYRKAFSMAFNMLTHCSKRYISPKAKLMFHEIRYLILKPTQFTMLKLKEYLDILKELNKKMSEDLVEKTGIDKDVFAKHFKADTMWEAKDLVKETKPGYFILIK